MRFGLSSGAALATIVGVLIEVPVMLMRVKNCLNSVQWVFPRALLRRLLHPSFSAQKRKGREEKLRFYGKCFIHLIFEFRYCFGLPWRDLIETLFYRLYNLEVGDLN
jgi:hypothetical protein